MAFRTIQVVEKRTFLDFFEVLEETCAEGEHGQFMCRAKTEPAQRLGEAHSKAAVKQVPDVTNSLSSTPKSSASTSTPSWADITDDDATSTSTSVSTDERKSSSKELARDHVDTRTTLMVRNLPNDYNREMFLAVLDDECLAGEYDFVYYPADFHTGSGLGYAFVNFTSHDEALRAWQLLHGYKDWLVPSAKVCEVSWSGPVQGLKANVQRYRDSPVMHHQVPDAFKPMIFSNGVRAEFPAPKKPIKHMPMKKAAKHRK